jgi:hypothetical protein
MRFKYFVPLCFGFLLIYLGAFGLEGFSGVNLHLYALGGESGGHLFSGAYREGGVYTDLKASISTSKIIGWQGTIPGSKYVADYVDASVWIAVAYYTATSCVWFIQVGWADLVTGFEGKAQDTGTYSFWQVWQENSPMRNGDIVYDLPVGAVHNYELKEQTDGSWAVIYDGATETIVSDFKGMGSCNTIMINEETYATDSSANDPAQIDAGQIVCSNMYAASGATSWPFVQSSSNVAATTQQAYNKVRFDSATQLTLGWLSGSSPTPTPTPTPKPSTPTPTPTPTSKPSGGNETNIPSFTFNIDWNRIWKNIGALVDANRQFLLFLGGLITLVSFVGFMLPPKRVQWMR